MLQDLGWLYIVSMCLETVMLNLALMQRTESRILER